jgi:hypothetical protein
MDHNRARKTMANSETHDRRSYLLHGGRLLDPRRDELVEGVEVLIEGDRVKAVSRPDGGTRGPLPAESATRIDLGGRTLMPESDKENRIKSDKVSGTNGTVKRIPNGGRQFRYGRRPIRSLRYY